MSDFEFEGILNSTGSDSSESENFQESDVSEESFNSEEPVETQSHDSIKSGTSEKSCDLEEPFSPAFETNFGESVIKCKASNLFQESLNNYSGGSEKSTGSERSAGSETFKNTENKIERDKSSLRERIESLKEMVEQMKDQIQECREYNKKEFFELEQVILELEKSQKISQGQEYENNSSGDENFLEGPVSKSKEVPSEKPKEISYDENLGFLQSLTLHQVEGSTYPSPSRCESTQSLTDLTIEEYDRKRLRTESNLSKSQSEKRRIQRKFAADLYRQKLLEVEKLCQEELTKVKQNFSQLEPLNKLASEWNSNIRINDKTKFTNHDLLVQEFQYLSSSLGKSSSSFHFGFSGISCKPNDDIFPIVPNSKLETSYSNEEFVFLTSK